jgi:hypothetical protein
MALVPLAAWSARAPESLAIKPQAEGVRLELPAIPVPPVAGSRYRLRVESTSDLSTWEVLGELSPDGSGHAILREAAGDSFRFFRLQPEIEVQSAASDGAEVFGYGRVFEEELARVGYIAPAEFAEQHRPSGYLEAISFDPRDAKYWDAFSADPAVVNQGKTPTSPGWRSFDYRLSNLELERFLRNGFVVTERLGDRAFAGCLYQLYCNDLPVFISADSVLHAWHFTYQRLMAELEETHLVFTLRRLLDGMAVALNALPDGVRNGPLASSVADADYFLAVGRSLLQGGPVATVLAPDPHVQRTLEAIRASQLHSTPPGFPMFGGSRLVDFSQYAVRGYYSRSPTLSRYFQAYMWTARADLRVLDLEDPAQSRRELGTAIVLNHLLKESGLVETWRELDAVIRLFVGRTDAMNFAQLEGLLAVAGINSLLDITSEDHVVDLQSRILAGDLGQQWIPADVHLAPLGVEQAQLPRAFVFTGQRFIADGWAMAQVTYDRILWPSETGSGVSVEKARRRVPSALDVAYGVLGNRAVGWEIARRMLQPPTADDFRDGYPYAHNLTAVAATFDRLQPHAWTDTLYTRWLAALRVLSRPTAGPEYPQAMRTRAWALRTLNTQLASYTELKHDTLLYGKQPYAANYLCEYPAGFVEPIPEFWRHMRDMAEAAAAGLESLSPPPRQIPVAPNGVTNLVEGRELHNARIEHCRIFAGHMETLARMAEKELRQEPFTEAEVMFIRTMLNADAGYGLQLDGWYADLYFEDYSVQPFFGPGGPTDGDDNGANRWDALVADIFTAPPDLGDARGGVLHVGTGNVDLLLIAVDNGPDRMIYGGPLLSHYEFLIPGPELQRLTDEAWKNRVPTNVPPRPEWTSSYLVPR